MALGTQFIGTPGQEWEIGSQTNATPQASHTLQTPTTTKPTSDEANGRIIFDMPRQRNLLKCVFFGRDADNEQFDVRFIGWQKLGDLWVPVSLAEVINCQLNSNLTGVSGELVTASDFFVDNYASTNGNTVEETSLEDKGISQVVVDPIGCPLIEADFKQGGTTAAEANLLYSGD